MYFTIRHVTRFNYEVPVSESVMEARMQPRSEAAQRCIRFSLSTSPTARVKLYADSEGNVVHHFNIPGRHERLTLAAEAMVECVSFPEPPESLSPGAWQRLDALTASGEFWEVLNPSPFVRRTSLLDEFTREIALERGEDPLLTLRRLVEEMHARFEYSPQTTRVDSPIDDALRARRGVCQDFAHIFIALARQLGVPCRYVSGYLFHEDASNALRSVNSATHAWVEAHLPEVGWVGLDPTNNLLAGERHIRVAIGRDYADVPPTRGVFKGGSAVRSELSVAVAVGPAQTAFGSDVPTFVPWMSQEATTPRADTDASQQQ